MHFGADGELMERAILFRFWGDRGGAYWRFGTGVDGSVLMNGRVRLGGCVGLGTPR
jgi:hypothetical protein